MFRESEKRGVFDSLRIRGCGAWIDDGHFVWHRGDHLLVDGVETEIADFKTRHIYEAKKRLDITNSNPLSKSEAYKLAHLCSLCTWQKPISAHLFSGWLVIASLCGALHWRPHIWLTGKPDSGKSWLMSNVLEPLIGKGVLNVQSASTEAGIRQGLSSNAFPVLFDESEGQDQRSQQRMQAVLELARQASTENGAPIVKGTQRGDAQLFLVRSCFCFASTSVVRNPESRHFTNQRPGAT